jgi:hypothetical protein
VAIHERAQEILAATNYRDVGWPEWSDLPDGRVGGGPVHLHTFLKEVRHAR